MQDDPILPVCESASAPQQNQMNTPHRILEAEDDISIRLLNTERLVHAGYEVDAAEDAAAAWKALNNDNYDLLITDHNMPKLTGVELLKKLRAAQMVLPVILLSGKVPNEEFTRYPWLQFTAVLLKPYTFAELLVTVKEVLSTTNGARQLLEPTPNFQSRPAIALSGTLPR